MKNLIEYSSNFSETTESLWFYSKNEETKFNATIANNSFKSFECKTKLLGNAEADGANEILKNATIGLSLKCVSNFWRSLQILLINSKIKLKL